MNKNITEEVIKQYEKIRKMGPCNMFDFNCVQNYANQFEFYDLASLDHKDYVCLLINFSRLMSEFNISQE